MKKYGNAELEALGKLGNLSGKVGQHLWSTLKPAMERDEFDFKDFETDDAVRKALRRGFLKSKSNCKLDLGLNIGKVSKQELAGLSVWNLKHLYELFYQQVFGLYVSFPDELMPEASNDFAWPACVPGIISSEISFNGGKLNMPRWKWTDKILDAVLKLDRGRDAWSHSFIVRVRPNWEADDDLKNISGNNMEAKGVDVMMLRERLILGQFIFWLTSEHLDRQTVTLTGSRYSDGGVSSVDFHLRTGKVSIYSYHPDNANPNWRFRQVVSCSPEANK